MKLALSANLILVASLMTAACQTADTAPEPAGEARAEMVRFLTEMPKAELHLHLEGSVPAQTVADLAVRNGLDSFKSVADVERSLANREPGLLGFLSHYRLTIHCDVDQPSSIEHIWQSIDLLRVERIDHGLDSIGDPGLVAELERRGICLTACPVQRSTDPEPQDLDKVRGLFEAGACVNLNTDDPAQFESGYLVDLLYGVQQAGGYSRHDMVRFMVHAFEASFLPRSGKDAYLESVRAFAAANGAGR